MAGKNYVGNGKAITTKYGTIYNLSLKLEDLKKLPTNDAGYIKLTLSELKSPDKYDNTHTVYENDYKPQANNVAQESQDLPY